MGNLFSSYVSSRTESLRRLRHNSFGELSGNTMSPPNLNRGGDAPRQSYGFDNSGLFELDLNALQWPAMTTTLVAAWFVASPAKTKRSAGFWCFIVSNGLWIVWGWHDGAYALIALQMGLFFLNLRGAQNNEPHTGTRQDVA